jgi:hypothetical protein
VSKVYLVTVHYHYSDTDIDSAHESEATAITRRDELRGDNAAVDVDVIPINVVTQARTADPCEKSS